MRDRLANANSIPEVFFSLVEEYPNTELYSQAVIDADDQEEVKRQWSGRDFAEAGQRVRKLISFLHSCGVRRGDKVAILSSSRPEWMEADLAILSLGGIVISVYQSLPADDVGYILFDSGANFVFAENQEQVDKLLELVAGPIQIPATEERSESTAQIGISKIIAFERVDDHPLVAQFEEILQADRSAPDTYLTDLKRDDLAAFVYTSGTTGPPKGVMQTHGNHLTNARQIVDAGIVDQDSDIMLFLPLAHSFAKLMGYLGFLTLAKLSFPGIKDRRSSKMNPDSVTKDMREAGATTFPVVPRLLEKMQAGVLEKANGTSLQAKILRLVLWSSEEVYNAKQAGKSAGLLARIAYEGTSSIRQKIKRMLFGPNLYFAVSGGAKLNPQVARFFDKLGVEVVEGYGLTETCVATNVNRPGAKKIGTVGPLVADDLEVKLDEAGEILFRGPNVALGYHNRESATKSAWDEDGWFHTGDLGAIDEQGFLSIVGRKKEILVSSYGKNIAPEEVEGQLKTSPYISQVVLVGDARAFCVALVTLDTGAVRGWAKRQGITLSDGDLADDKRVYDLVWGEVERISAELASYEAPKRIGIVAEEFTVENGLLTPTFKVKRKLVLDQYQNTIEELYTCGT